MKPDEARQIVSDIVDSGNMDAAIDILMTRAVGARKVICGHCGSEWWTGAGTSRRSHGIYCSTRCRVAAARSRKAEATP